MREVLRTEVLQRLPRVVERPAVVVELSPRLEQLAVVALKVVRVRDGRFIYPRPIEVLRELFRRRQTTATKVSGASGEVKAVGIAILNRRTGPIYGNNTGHYDAMSLREFVGLGQEFREAVPSLSWRRFFRRVSRVFPEGTTTVDVAGLLLHFNSVARRPVEEAIQYVRNFRSEAKAA
ncbi:MAG: hypothetical protein Q7S60_04885 [bacterium]|nr:hypothetical protein [bacterium]